MRKVRSKKLIFTLSLASLLTVTGLIYIYLWASAPLHYDGSSIFNGQSNQIDIGLTNNGFTKIKITDVTVNNGMKPEQIELMSSSYVEIKDNYIAPAWTGVEVRDSLFENPVQIEPNQNVLHIVNQEHIESIDICYLYFGFSKTMTLHPKQKT